MNAALRVTKSARRRGMISDFVRRSAYLMAVTFVVSSIYIAVAKYYLLHSITLDQSMWIAIASAVSACIFAGVWTLLRKPTIAEASVEVDLRMKLKERLSSALTISPQDRQQPIFLALAADADRLAERVDIRDAFPLIQFRRPWIVIASMLPAAVFATLILLPDRSANARTADDGSKIIDKVIVEESTKELEKMLEQAKEDAQNDEELEDAEFFESLQKKLGDLKKSEPRSEKKIIKDLNALKAELEKKRDENGSSDQMKKNLSSLKELSDGPAEELVKAISDGDLEQAAKSLEELMNKLENGEMSADQQSQLDKQMGEIAKALEQAVQEHEQAKEELEKKIKDAEMAGDMNAVAEMREQLQDIKQASAEMSEMSKMAEEMRDAQKQMQEGNTKQAAEAMKKMKEQVEKMSKNGEKRKALDKLLQQAKDAKNKTCENCNGEGEDSEGKGKGKMKGKSKPSRGMGEGTGSGPRDEEETETRFKESQVRTDPEEGETIYDGKAGGANKKGVTRESIEQSIRQSVAEDEDAMETITLPKRQRDQTREYFDSLRK